MSIDTNYETRQDDPERSIFLPEAPESKPRKEELMAQFLALDGDPVVLFTRIVEHYPQSPRRTVGELQFHILQARGGVPSDGVEKKIEFYDVLVDAENSLKESADTALGVQATRAMIQAE